MGVARGALAALGSMGRRSFREGMAAYAAAGPQGQFTAGPADLSIVAVNGTLVEADAVGSGGTAAGLLVIFQRHGIDQPGVLSLVEPFEGVHGRCVRGFYNRPGLDLCGKSLRKMLTCQGTARRCRERGEGSPDVSQPEVIVSPPLQPRQSLAVLLLDGVQVFDLLEDTPDVFSGSEGVLCVHPQQQGSTKRTLTPNTRREKHLSDSVASEPWPAVPPADDP